MDKLNYGVIGNCCTAALISDKGSIDWLCFPNFDPQKLPDGQRETLQSRMPQDLPPVLAEPHAGWVNALEQEWLHRYGTH